MSVLRSVGVFLLGVVVTFPQNSYVHRLASALLHGCRTNAPERVRIFLSPSTFSCRRRSLRSGRCWARTSELSRVKAV